MTKLKHTPASDQMTSWSNPNLAPDQFLYQRLGPWPQPCPSYPMDQAPEVLNIPPIETQLWNATIGMRYLQTLTSFPAQASAKAVADGSTPIPPDDEFVRMMTKSVYSRFLKNTADNTWVSDFGAMVVIEKQTLTNTYCHAVSCTFTLTGKQFTIEQINFPEASGAPLVVTKNDPAWNLAKAYALQGAAYYTLFVTHPALHFPMDSVNAITKSAVPHTHPLFQLLYPHTSYTLALDNAVLEGENTIVNNHAPGTWFDPLTGNGYEIRRLFNVGYKGRVDHPGVYPAFDYMQPWMDTSTPYGACLKVYYKPFFTFCSTVADLIHRESPNDTYVARWAKYISSNVEGFPNEQKIFNPGVLANVMAIYMWDVSVSHGADHYSFANDIAPKGGDATTPPLAAWKFLRIRRPAPTSKSDGADVKVVGDLCTPDDLYRTEMAQEMFFKSSTIPPSLFDTHYAFTSKELLDAQKVFHDDLALAAAKVTEIMDNFMQLKPDANYAYSNTIPASIQY